MKRVKSSTSNCVEGDEDEAAAPEPIVAEFGDEEDVNDCEIAEHAGSIEDLIAMREAQYKELYEQSLVQKQRLSMSMPSSLLDRFCKIMQESNMVSKHWHRWIDSRR